MRALQTAAVCLQWWLLPLLSCRLEARFSYMPGGDDGVLACCRWFARQPGGFVKLISEDRILRLRATDEGLSAANVPELRAAVKDGKCWFA